MNQKKVIGCYHFSSLAVVSFLLLLTMMQKKYKILLKRILKWSAGGEDPFLQMWSHVFSSENNGSNNTKILIVCCLWY